MDKLIRLNEAAELLGVCKQTLRLWDRSGQLKALRTKGGHRRYRMSDLEDVQKGECAQKLHEGEEESH